jgi:hypothetical protein
VSVSSEWLLVAGILTFYLQDAARLAYFDEVVVSGGRTWRVAVEASTEMRGRFLWIPSPLLPARTTLHASWLAPVEGTATDTVESLRAFVRSLWPVRLGCVMAGLVVLVAIPCLLLLSAPPTWLLAALLAWLAITLGMLGFLVLRRQRLGLTRRGLATLASECLLCPPYAVNLYRKLCDQRGFRGDPIAFAAANLPPPHQQRLLDAIERRLALFAQSSDEAAVRRLQDARDRIRGTLRAALTPAS